ncbi:uncharacterized protein LOC126409914 [Nymphaea colorata]|nr:uncharacterized protein LOC126409914 [Nymphaea colorata]
MKSRNGEASNGLLGGLKLPVGMKRIMDCLEKLCKWYESPSILLMSDSCFSSFTSPRKSDCAKFYFRPLRSTPEKCFRKHISTRGVQICFRNFLFIFFARWRCSWRLSPPRLALLILRSCLTLLILRSCLTLLLPQPPPQPQHQSLFSSSRLSHSAERSLPQNPLTLSLETLATFFHPTCLRHAFPLLSLLLPQTPSVASTAFFLLHSVLTSGLIWASPHQRKRLAGVKDNGLPLNNEDTTILTNLRVADGHEDKVLSNSATHIEQEDVPRCSNDKSLKQKKGTQERGKQRKDRERDRPPVCRVHEDLPTASFLVSMSERRRHRSSVKTSRRQTLCNSTFCNAIIRAKL